MPASIHRNRGDIPVTVLDGGARVLIAPGEDADLTLPFFNNSMAELVARGVPVRLLAASDFIRLAPNHRPIGFLFHVSRCGSTLLSRALEQGEDLYVFREPDAVNVALSPPRQVEVYEPFVSAALGWLGAFAADMFRDFAVKLPSLGSMVAGELCGAFPEVPAAVLLRHPHRMVESMLRSPAASLEWVASAAVEAWIGQQLSRTSKTAALTLHARWAAIWASMVESIAPLIASGRVTPFTYGDLVADSVATTGRILNCWGGRTLADGWASRISDLETRDAKSPDRLFDRIAGPPRPKLDHSERIVVDPIVGPALDELARVGVILGQD